VERTLITIDTARTLVAWAEARVRLQELRVLKLIAENMNADQALSHLVTMRDTLQGMRQCLETLEQKGLDS
jgi:hypothetical protein